MRLPLGPLRGPLTLAASLGEGLLEVALVVMREARAALEEVRLEPDAPATGGPEPEIAAERPDPRPGRSSRSRGRRAEPPRPRPASRPLPPEAKTLDDDPVPVAEFGEESAQDTPGPEINVDEPWEGYRRMSAAEVRRRLEDEEREVLAAVVLFEGMGKKRRTVMDAAERRLDALTPPRA